MKKFIFLFFAIFFCVSKIYADEIIFSAENLKKFLKNNIFEHKNDRKIFLKLNKDADIYYVADSVTVIQSSPLVVVYELSVKDERMVNAMKKNDKSAEDIKEKTKEYSMVYAIGCEQNKTVLHKILFIGENEELLGYADTNLLHGEINEFEKIICSVIKEKITQDE